MRRMYARVRRQMARKIVNRVERWNYFRGTSIPLHDNAVEFANRGFDLEADAKQIIRTVRDYTMTSYEKVCLLWNQVAHLERAGINGALVECGTWRGGSCAVMALASLEYGQRPRDLHLFDSFEGLPEPRAEMDGIRAARYAGHRASGALRSIGRMVGKLEDNRHLLEEIVQYPLDKLHYHKGWFQQTIPAASATIGPVALLRLDGDLYESTKVCLEHLFELVVQGGFVVIDDYNHWEGCKRATDEFLASCSKPYYLNHIDDGARYLIK